MKAMPDFAVWFRAVHGHSPYPWQARLAEHVVATGTWPRTIGVPTGAGKTATLDVALHALAAEAHLPPAQRRAPRRIVMVVDRRTVVDQSFERASALRAALVDACDGPLLAMRERLLSLMGRDGGREEPLQLALLRGGVPRDDGWARRPDQALIALSTVDQVGSRLLFRGYGVTPAMRPLHAGLLGHDTLFLLDEVHLARAFSTTLSSLAARWRGWAQAELPSRWQVCALSATSGDAQAFSLSPEDRALPRLAARLSARKTLRRTELATSTHDRRGAVQKRWVRGLHKEAEGLLDAGCQRLGVLVNRVDTAVAVAAELRAGRRADVLLVTGRMRGVDRVQVSAELARRAGPDAPLDAERPLVCVSTQCIEAGADLDFDGMVTELASLDALVQRFGRLNRTGRHEDAPVVVVAPRKPEALDDPVYGASLGPTWSWLASLGDEAQVGPDALEGLLAEAPADARPASPPPAVLLPPHLDLLSQTSAPVHPDPDPAIYLRGTEAPRPEVTLVWRADLALHAPATAARVLAAVPPTAWEGLALPVGAARRWLAGEAPPSVADVEGDADEQHWRKLGTGRPVALRWDGQEAEPVAAADIAPGQTLVLPSTRGGLIDGTFSPGGEAPVVDAGDLARTVRDGRVHLRLDPAVHSQLLDLAALPPGPDGEARSTREAAAALDPWLEAAVASSDEATPLGSLLRLLLAGGHRAHWLRGSWLLLGRRRLPTERVLSLARGSWAPPSDEGLTGGAHSFVSSGPVELHEHLAGVGAWARSFAEAVGLPSELAADLEAAGRWHDLGKAHPRFQVLLHGGDEIRAAGGRLLAKSAPGLLDRDARSRAWRRSGLRDGFRHEMASVALLQSPEGRALLERCSDPELVLHLVGSHHGHGRPRAPIEGPEDRAPQDVRVEVGGAVLTAPDDHGQDRLDSGVTERFWTVQRRYGWWGLAWLEALLRLADHRRSEAEERAVEEAR